MFTWLWPICMDPNRLGKRMNTYNLMNHRVNLVVADLQEGAGSEGVSE